MNERRRFLRVLGGGAVAMGFGCAASQKGTGGAGAGGSAGVTGTGGSSSTGDGSSSTGSSSTGSNSSTGSVSSGGNCGAGGASSSGTNSDACSSNAGTFDVGTPADYPGTGLFKVTNLPSNVMIGRDAGGFYAISSLCTHECCDLNERGTFTTANGTPVVHCGCHGSEFSYDGAVVHGPANAPLAAYALTLGCDGNLYVDTTKIVAHTQRLPA
jgi:Rieske Fe-S protein